MVYFRACSKPLNVSLPITFDRMGIPNEIIIELTRECNLDCKFCFNKQEQSDFKPILKRDVFNILEDISDSGIKAVRFTGGEPFLRKDLIEILKKAKSLGLYVILNSNGFLINQKNIHYLNYVDLVLFSLHSIDRFERVKESTRLLKDYNLKIMLATIMTKENIKNLENFYKLVSSLKQPNLSEWFLLRQIPNETNKEPLSKADIKKIYEKVTSYNKKYDLNIKIANALPFCAIEEDLASISKGGIFDSGYSRIVIDCNGHYKTDYYSNDLLRSINEHSILDIWNSKEMEDIRNYRRVNNKCKECYYLEKCKGGLLKNETLRDFDNIKLFVSIALPTHN